MKEWKWDFISEEERNPTQGSLEELLEKWEAQFVKRWESELSAGIFAKNHVEQDGLQRIILPPEFRFHETVIWAGHGIFRNLDEILKTGKGKAKWRATSVFQLIRAVRYLATFSALTAREEAWQEALVHIRELREEGAFLPHYELDELKRRFEERMKKAEKFLRKLDPQKERLFERAIALNKKKNDKSPYKRSYTYVQALLDANSEEQYRYLQDPGSDQRWVNLEQDFKNYRSRIKNKNH